MKTSRRKYPGGMIGNVPKFNKANTDFVEESNAMSESEHTLGPFEGLPNALARELVDMARHTSYGDGVVQQVQAKLDAHYADLVKALEAIRNGPWSQNCDYCCKTTKYSGKPRIKSHKDDCPVAIAEAALTAAGKAGL